MLFVLLVVTVALYTMSLVLHFSWSGLRLHVCVLALWPPLSLVLRPERRFASLARRLNIYLPGQQCRRLKCQKSTQCYCSKILKTS